MGKTIATLMCFLLYVCVNSAESKTNDWHRLKFRNKKGLDIIGKEFNNLLTFKDILKPMLIPRVPGSAGIETTERHIVDILKTLNWDVEIDEFSGETPYGPKTFRNIIATFDKKKRKRLVLAAHYDSKIIHENGKDFIGATDSAVPCAILLDVVTQLGCMMSKGNGDDAKDLTVQLVFFDGEEAFVEWTATDSIYGSRHLAEKWEKEDKLKDIYMMVLLDLIGSNDVHFESQFEDTEYYFEQLVRIEKQLADNLLLNKDKYGMSKKLFHSTKDQRYRYYKGGIEDDHIPFLHRGVKVLHLISAPFPKVWHTIHDDEKAIDYALTENFNKVFRIFVANFFHLETSGTAAVCRRKK